MRNKPLKGLSDAKETKVNVVKDKTKISVKITKPSEEYRTVPEMISIELKDDIYKISTSEFTFRDPQAFSDYVSSYCSWLSVTVAS